MIDLSGYSKSELEDLKVHVDKAIIETAAREREEALRAAEKAAAEFGFTLSEITAQTRAGRKSGIPKYFNPVDPDQTWTGKGRQPMWFKAALRDGVDPAKMEL